MTVSTHRRPLRVFALWWAGRPFDRVRGRFDEAITATESAALYRGFIARGAFDYVSIQRPRITSSAYRDEGVFLDILDDRRSDDPRRRWVG